MAAPTYFWTCQRCHASNAAGARACAACGVQAWGDGRQAVGAVLPEQPSSIGKDELGWIWSERALLVPEIFLAGILLLASPLWLVFLARHAHYAAGVVLLVGVVQAVFVGRASFSMKSAGGLHVAAWIAFVAALVAGALSGLAA